VLSLGDELRPRGELEGQERHHGVDVAVFAVRRDRFFCLRQPAVAEAREVVLDWPSTGVFEVAPERAFR
jgi:hypothetical protein